MTLKKIKLEQVSVPTQGFSGEIYKHFNKLNFHTLKKYWEEYINPEVLLTFNPIFVKSTSKTSYELVAGFRSFQILHFMKTDKIQAIDVSTESSLDHNLITLAADISQMLFWSIDTLHANTNISQFLKSIDQSLPAELNKLGYDSQVYNQLISQGKGRLKHYKESQLTKILKSKSDESRGSDEV